MNLVENNHHAPVSPVPDDNDKYYADDAGFPSSPQLKPMKVNLQPSPTPPPAVPLPPASPESSAPSSPDRKSSHKSKVRPTLSDAVLIGFMGGGQHTETARRAGHEPLASGPEEEEDTMMNGTHVEINKGKLDGEADQATKDAVRREPVEKDAADESDLPSVAARAMNMISMAQGNSPPTSAEAAPTTRPEDSKSDTRPVDGKVAGDVPMEDVKPTYPLPSITSLDERPKGILLPEVKKLEIQAPGSENLPPIQSHSPLSAQSNGNKSNVTLPSISSLASFPTLPEQSPAGTSPHFVTSPPGSRPPPFAVVPGHGSPPKSPEFRRELPSPGRGFYNYAPGSMSHRRPSQADGYPYSSAGEYSSSNTETPSTDQSGATPAIDRMSIDGITNPPIGVFQCTYPNCTAQPFQTQYLLNSHANVHSSNRPHYCSVKGCPRSEGGKGFKRKNEMIRHGLVHDSPGYVCPFCPDREHKYPRPDNLQRHVRVHHVDKDKDDPQLRDVLSQRPEGPSRGRRRRGGTS